MTTAQCAAIIHRLRLPDSIAFASHLPTATNMHHAAYPACDLMLLRESPKMSKVVTACLSSLGGALPSITAARFNLDFSVPQRYVQFKDQASDIP